MKIEEINDDDVERAARATGEIHETREGGGRNAIDARRRATTTTTTTAELREEVERLRAMRAMAHRSGDEAFIAEAQSVEEAKYYAENRLEYTNGDVYVGETVETVRHGVGTHTCSTGDVYEGGWKDDKRHGHGKITYVSGLMYEGDWEDDKTCGKGVCAYVNGDAYDGEWRNDHRWGWGIQLFANGDEYEGEWVDDIIEGNGMYTFADGSTFTGSMMSGSRVRGRFVTKDGDVEYDGDWRGSLRHGRGKFVSVGEMKYIGQWEDDKRHGRGKCEFSGGSTYDGEWKHDAFHGSGEWKTPTQTYVGEFVDGHKQGQGTTVFHDNEGEYRGAYVKGFEHGQGKRLYADGEIYRGEWVAGKRHGKGSCAYANGDQYQGEWRSDKRHGYGFCLFADGTKYRGEWEDDCWCQSTADPLFTKVFGPGVVRAVAGEPAMIGIEARDELKNKRLSGGDLFTVRLTLAGASDDGVGDSLVEYGTVTDNGDGTYVAHYTCTVAGEYACEVLIGADEHCGHSPYEVSVASARASAKHSVVSGDGLKRALVGQRAEFVVEARDEFDNVVARELIDQLPLKVSITDVNGHEINTTGAGVVIEDDGDGQCVVSYAPARSGFYRVTVSSNDVLIGASPYALRVLDARADENDASFANMSDETIADGSIASKPNDLARDWEIIARTDYARDGDDFGWDSAPEDDDEDENARLARRNPDVPIITNYEDMYKVPRLQKRMMEKRAAEQSAKLADMKAKLELLELAKSSNTAAAKDNSNSIQALDM